MSLTDPRARQVPPRALGLSFAALLVPVAGALAFPDALGEQGSLLWLLALVPAFLLSYYRGWRGVATSLAVGMVVLSLTQALASWRMEPIPDTLLAVVVAYLVIAMSVGFLADRFHRDRSIVEDMAFTDPLTRLANRRHAMVFLENEFAAARRGRLLTVVLFDLDGFKSYNDTYGHQAGDEALRAFAGVLARTTRRMNLSCRYGGEEYLTVLAGADMEGAVVFAERVRMALQAQGLGDPALTVSAGVATYDISMETPDELLALADDALYQAKRGGRNRVHAAEAGAGSREDGRTREGEIRTSPRPAAAPASDALSDRGLGEDRSILVVEPDEDTRSLLRAFLAGEGFDVVEAGNARQARHALQHEFDLVLTSLHVPGAAAHTTLETTKALWPATQVVVMTGLNDARMAAEALQAGADRYLFRPFGMPELRGHLVDALARRERLLAAVQEAEGTEGDRVEAAAQTVEALIRGTMALVKAVEVRDPYTRGHSARVGAYAAVLADVMDPDGRQIDRDRLHLACELHDVGKIGVSDAVLNKTEPLSEAEVREIRKHPGAGRDILARLMDDPLILGVTHWHHERWDGSGYPDGLQGQDIPLPARIVGMADALDAMTCPRAYRDAIPWAEAMERIESSAGVHFDPVLVAGLDGVRRRLERVFRSAPQPG